MSFIRYLKFKIDYFVSAVSLVDKFNVAADTSQLARGYYEKLVKGISDIDLKQWEKEIKTAEDTRLEDRSVMDILGAKEPGHDQSTSAAASEGECEHGSDEEWIQLAMNIEEKQ